MKALVLAGGGAKGAFQAGAIYHLLAECGRNYDIICGTSTGALNGSFLAQFATGSEIEAATKLKELWTSIRGDRDILRSWYRLGFVGTILAMIRGKLSLKNSAPLWKLVDQNVNQGALLGSGKILRVSAVQVGSWECKFFGEQDANIIEAVKASSAFPVFFRPVQIDGTMWVDGGVREITPMAEAIRLGATEIDVISCSPDNATQAHPRRKWRLRHLAAGLINTMFSEVARGDFRSASLYNRMAEAEIEKKKRIVKIRVLRPPAPLGDTLDFNPIAIRENYKKGYLFARDGGFWMPLL